MKRVVLAIVLVALLTAAVPVVYLPQSAASASETTAAFCQCCIFSPGCCWRCISGLWWDAMGDLGDDYWGW